MHVAASSLNTNDSESYYIIPNGSSHVSCPGERPCYTLNQYARNSSRSSKFWGENRNLSLILFGGVHVLSYNFTISNVERISVHRAGISTSRELAPIVNVLNGSSILFRNVTIMLIDGIKINGQQLPDSVNLQISDLVVFKMSYVEFSKIHAVIHLKGPGKLINSLLYFDHSTFNSSHIQLSPEDSMLHLADSLFIDVDLAIHIAAKARRSQFSRQKFLLIEFCKFFSHYHSTFVTLSSIYQHLLIETEIVASSFISIRNQTKKKTGLYDYVQTSGPNPGLGMKVSREVSVRLTVKHSKFSSFEVEVQEDSLMKMEFLSCLFLGNLGNSKLDLVNLDSGVKVKQQALSRVNLHISDSYFGLFTIALDVGILSTRPHTHFIMNLTKVFMSSNKVGVKLFTVASAIRAYMENVDIRGSVFGRAFLCKAQISTNVLVTINNSRFSDNRGQRGAAISVVSYSTSARVVLNNVNFINNFDFSILPAIVCAINSKVIVTNCTFSNNLGTPVLIDSGTLYLSGNNIFEKNLAYRGGGLYLSGSELEINVHSTLSFISNVATDVGGAIYISKRPIINKLLVDTSSISTTLSPCFFRIPSVYAENVIDITFNFTNNSAANGGEDMYGVEVYNTCFVSGSKPQVMIDNRKMRALVKIHNSINTSLSAISSDPKRVCLCNKGNAPECATFPLLNMTFYPGERFNLSLFVVGDDFGTITAPVYAKLANQVFNEPKRSLGAGQSTQLTNFKQCTNAEYSIHSFNRNEGIVLTASASNVFLERQSLNQQLLVYSHDIYIYSQTKHITPGLLHLPIYINVTLKTCPLGFELKGDPPSCRCHSTFSSYGLDHCVIVNHTGYVYRSGTVWVNATFNTSMNTGIIVHRHCPNGYCKADNTSVELEYPDMQCAWGHSGILCGRCQHNLSLALGSDRCLKCHNSNYLSLLIVFGVSGFLLVAFIKLLDLTTARGTINGLIFYGNIVWAHQSLIFSVNDESVSLKVVRVFIAWINLDFGIETCFSQGLDAYSKMWLQFIFPIYVWIIVGFMIISSHYSSLATKIFGNNSVPVLSTLFLLSYAKLLRTIITSLGFAILRYPHKTEIVWLFDGNIQYFGLKHAFLAVVALGAMLLLWAPYTFTLLVVPFLKGKSHKRPLRWINKWKPFYDAYFGPLKVQHQYWVGMLLVLRGIILVIFATTSSTFPNVNLVVTISVSALVLLYAGHVKFVYESKYLSLLESSFFVNLIVLYTGTLYENTIGETRPFATFVSTGFAFIQLICIILYHCLVALKGCVQIHSSRIFNPLRRFGLQNKQLKDRKMCHLREELLESDDQL